MKKTPDPLVCRTTVPIYQVRLILGVAKAPADLRKRLPPGFREDTSDEWADMEGSCALQETVGVILFKKAALAHDVIAHEVFHMTHRIMERAGEVFSPEHHEPSAYLHGWIARRVYAQLRKAGLRVR